ncbi:MAG: hypothetical protein ACRD0J_02105 [Acidimicrobiales bacterium]
MANQTLAACALGLSTYAVVAGAVLPWLWLVLGYALTALALFWSRQREAG